MQSKSDRLNRAVPKNGEPGYVRGMYDARPIFQVYRQPEKPISLQSLDRFKDWKPTTVDGPKQLEEMRKLGYMRKDKHMKALMDTGSHMATNNMAIKHYFNLVNYYKYYLSFASGVGPWW